MTVTMHRRCICALSIAIFALAAGASDVRAQGPGKENMPGGIENRPSAVPAPIAPAPMISAPITRSPITAPKAAAPQPAASKPDAAKSVEPANAPKSEDAVKGSEKSKSKKSSKPITGRSPSGEGASRGITVPAPGAPVLKGDERRPGGVERAPSAD